MKYTKLFSIAAIAVLAAGCGNTGSRAEGPWAEAEKIVSEMTKVHFPERSVSILEFGAVEGDSTKLADEAINLAIISMNQQGGGNVIVPPGTFYTGPITLKSNVNLHLSEGSVLKFTSDVKKYMPAVLTRWEGIDCYNAHPLIYAYGETNIALTGKGTIDGSGNEGWWQRGRRMERRDFLSDPDDPKSKVLRGSRLRLLEWGETQTPVADRVFTDVDCMRPQTINFNRCTTVLIEDVTLLNSPFWVMHPLFCKDLTVRRVTANNNGPNGDGCDPESCCNVLIEECVFNTGDDCIAIKSGRNEDGRKWNVPSENIVVRNCTMANGHGGVVIGSEISGGYRNLYVENCKMDSPNLERVIRIKTSTARGGLIENIHVRNVEVGQCREAVLRINLNYEQNEPAKRGFIPTVRNVTLENVTCQKSKYGVWLYGLDDTCNIQNVNLKDCTFNGVTTGGNFAHGQHEAVKFENCTINGEPVEEWSAEGAGTAKISDGFSS